MGAPHGFFSYPGKSVWPVSSRDTPSYQDLPLNPPKSVDLVCSKAQPMSAAEQDKVIDEIASDYQKQTNSSDYCYNMLNDDTSNSTLKYKPKNSKANPEYVAEEFSKMVKPVKACIIMVIPMPKADVLVIENAKQEICYCVDGKGRKKGDIIQFHGYGSKLDTHDPRFAFLAPRSQGRYHYVEERTIHGVKSAGVVSDIITVTVTERIITTVTISSPTLGVLADSVDVVINRERTSR